MARNERTRNRSFIGTLFKILLGITLSIVILILGIYLYLKYALGIDIIDIKRKLDLINKEFAESTIVTSHYTNEDAYDGFTIMFGENSIYTKNEDDENYTFNSEEFANSTLVSGDVSLTANQFASCINLFLKNFTNEEISVSEVNIGINLKQIVFSNFEQAEANISVDVLTIVQFDFAGVKNEIKKINNFLGGFILKYIPDNIYISTKALLSVNTEENYSYTVTPKTIRINNLTETQSQEILDLFSKLYKNEKGDSLNETLTNQFMDIIFSGAGKGFLGSINGLNTFSFKLVDDTIYIVLS